jgi:hypothetical protein
MGKPRSSLSLTYVRYAFARLLGKRVSRPPTAIRFGNLRSVHPVSIHFGYDRGTPVDRYYIEKFLAVNANDIRGRVLEIKDAGYTARFGGSRVSKSDVLSLLPDVGKPTIVGDLADGKNLASSSFECIILTQTLQLIFDVHAALVNLHRILVPGGVLLATVPGISQIARGEKGDYWRFTSPACERLFFCVFPKENLEVVGYGNVLSAISFLEGISSEELTPRELDFRDPDYEVTVCIRAVKGDC